MARATPCAPVKTGTYESSLARKVRARGRSVRVRGRRPQKAKECRALTRGEQQRRALEGGCNPLNPQRCASRSRERQSAFADGAVSEEPCAVLGSPPVGSGRRSPPVGSGRRSPPVGSGRRSPPVGSGYRSPPVGSGRRSPPVGSGRRSPPVGASCPMGSTSAGAYTRFPKVGGRRPTRGSSTGPPLEPSTMAATRARSTGREGPIRAPPLWARTKQVRRSSCTPAA
jgi:hypothetical protein